MSATVKPASVEAIVVAGIGPVSILIGSTPARAKVWKRALGRRPRSAARDSLMMSRPAAPSPICELLAAVILPSGRKAGLSEPRASTSHWRIPSSVAHQGPGLDDSARIAVEDLFSHRQDFTLEATLIASSSGTPWWLITA